MSYVEAAVAREDDLQDGEMRLVQVGDHDVLLARIDGRLHALHAHCTHYGAPLADGAIRGDRLVCPWHHACFHVPSGDQLEPPGMDSLPTYAVRIEDGDVVVRVPEDTEGRRPPVLGQRREGDDRLFAVVGAGAAGAYAVEALRAAGFRGRVVLVSADEGPYDRPNVSKEYLQGEAPEAWMPLRDEAFYEAHGIERRLGVRVTRADAASRTLTFEGGETLACDGLVLCPGATPRTLDVPGAHLDGVFTLRTLDDGRRLREAAGSAERAVVVGASFIGLESAWSLATHGVEVTVVAPDEVPLARVFGERVGRRVQRIHEENGVRFRLGTTADAFEGDGRVAAVRVGDERLPADLVVVGIGVDPATGFVDGVEKRDDGGIVVDGSLRAAERVYVAGDAAAFPDPFGEGHVRIEHWRLAAQHGRLAGRALAGEAVAWDGVPFFWSAHWGKSIRYVGHAEAWDEIRYDGDVEDGAFLAYYVRGGRVRAVCGLGRDRDAAALHLRMQEEGALAVEDVTGKRSSPRSSR